MVRDSPPIRQGLPPAAGSLVPNLQIGNARHPCPLSLKERAGVRADLKSLVCGGRKYIKPRPQVFSLLAQSHFLRPQPAKTCPQGFLPCGFDYFSLAIEALSLERKAFLTCAAGEMIRAQHEKPWPQLQKTGKYQGRDSELCSQIPKSWERSRKPGRQGLSGRGRGFSVCVHASPVRLTGRPGKCNRVCAWNCG